MRGCQLKVSLMNRRAIWFGSGQRKELKYPRNRPVGLARFEAKRKHFDRLKSHKKCWLIVMLMYRFLQRLCREGI
jgi:hypothetical protein